MTVGKIKKIAMYQMQFDNITPEEQKLVADYGRQVITEEQYFEIGAVQALKNYIEIGKSVSKKKNKRKRISKSL